MVQEQIARAEDIDTLFKTCFGHKMGPLQTADLIGLDTILQSLQVLYESFNDDKYRPSFLLKENGRCRVFGREIRAGVLSLSTDVRRAVILG